MSSVIVPPVDLAPGMPSRVVTISATDVTEGGKSLEGQMVRFALSDTLDVSSGGDVIAKTQAEVVLDANGEGSIRLPVYDEDVRTWCGQDWAILATATWGSQKAIRVPAGTTSIALSELPPVRPLRGREKQWAITGVSLTVTTGTEAGQASGSASLHGGILDIDLSIPPAGPHAHDDRYYPQDQIGARSIAFDTDGTPYWSPMDGTHFLLLDIDGVPIWQQHLSTQADTDTDGTPYIVYTPTEESAVAWDSVEGKPAQFPPTPHEHQGYVTDSGLADALASLPTGDVLAGPSETPAWSGGAAARSWDPSLHLYNGESPDLDGLRGIVRDGGHLIYLGDSKTQGQGSDPRGKERESMPAVLARYASARPGIVFCNLALQYESWWTVKGFTFTPSLHATWQTGHSTYWINLSAPTEHTAITWWARALDAPATVTPSVDGVAGASVSIPQGTAWTATRIDHGTEAAHTYQWDTTERIEFLGVRYEYATPGLTVTNAGRAGARIGTGDYGFRQSTDPGSLWHEGVTMAEPDGMIVQLGTNYATIPLADGYAEFDAVGVPWAIVAFGCTPDTPDRLARVTECYSLADSLDVPLIDHRHLLGNQEQAASRGLAEPGGTPHENARGYRLEGSLHHRILS